MDRFSDIMVLRKLTVHKFGLIKAPHTFITGVDELCLAIVSSDKQFNK